MRFVINRDDILKPLQLVAGVVERRQTLAILGNVLLVLEGDQLSLTGTDLEVELLAKVKLTDVTGSEPGEVTIPARKLMDICKSLPDQAQVEFVVEDQKVIVKSGRSRFSLSTLPAAEFPVVEESLDSYSFEIAQSDLSFLLDKTAFAMAQQDVRYYLNGLMIEVKQGTVRTVATDGHRLAMCTLVDAADVSIDNQAIVPRKGIMELSRLLGQSTDKVLITLGSNHIRAHTGNFVFTSKLIDGKFPDYDRVVPKGGNKIIIGDKAQLRQSFSRAAILANEKYRGVRLMLSDDTLKLVANNPEQEEAEEEVSVAYKGESLEIGFNVSYLQDVINVIDGDNLKIVLADANSSALISEEDDEESGALFVVMPMRM